jgi:hypothetical protein
MSLNAMFNEVEFEIQSMAWPKANGKAPAVAPVIELLRDLRTEVTSRLDTCSTEGPGTPDDVITIAQSQFRALVERGQLPVAVADTLCAQLAAMRSQVNAGTATLGDPEDAACYNE